MSNVKTKTTKQAKVLNALKEGKALTSADIRNRYKAGNPQAVIQALRFAGNPIYLNEVKFKNLSIEGTHIYKKYDI